MRCRRPRSVTRLKPWSRMARQRFREVEQAADRLSDEISLLDLATAEACARLQSGGRDVREVMRELGFTGADK